LSINGNRTSSINWLVDGSRNVDTGSNLTLLTTPSVDAIQEFTILTSNYAPEFGRNGGGVINVVTRQGTDEFHGNLYEFVRNDALNARDPFITRPIAALSSPGHLVFKQPLRYNDFGGTIGGPVHFLNFGSGVPAHYDGRGRTYFFFSQEFRRVRSTSIPVGTVATDAQRTAICATQTCNPNSLALLQYFLRPNEPNTTTGVFDQFRRVTPVAGNFRQSMFRFDHRITSKYSLMVRYIQDNFDRTDPGGNLFQDPFILTNASGTLFPNVASGATTTPGKNLVASVRMSLTPNIINEVAFDYAFNEIISRFTGTGTRINTPGFTSPELFPENTAGTLPNITISGLSGLTFTPPANINNPSYTWRDNLTWVKGRHTMKFGVFLAKEQKNENAQNPTHGSWTFDGTRSGNAWNDFLLGLPSAYSESLREVRLQLRYNSYEFYAQDTWRITPRLTIDFGARYSIFANPIDANNYLIAFRPDFYDPAKRVTLTANGNNVVAGSGDRFNGIIFAGVNSPYGRRVQSNQYNTLGPRFGFAYDVFGTGKTVVRGGYGVYYDRTLSGIVEQNAFANPLLSPSVAITNPATFSDPASGTTNTALPVLALTSTGDKFKAPQTLQYNLGVQHQLLHNLFIEVAYVGSSGHNLLRQINVNAPLPRFARTGAPLGNRNFYRPYAGYGNINERRTDADSNYNSGQLTLTKRFSDGFQFGAVYTFSKNITDASTDRSDTVQDNLHPERERAVSQFDRTHVFSANFFYELPFGRSKKFNLGSAGNAILGGFQLAGVYTLQSGTPITITQTSGTYIRNGVSITTSSDPLDTNITVRPNLICDPNLPRGQRTATRWFNTNCFDPVLSGSTAYGNAGRGIVRGPGINNFDLSLYRTVRFTESVNVQLRAEAFNVFNIVNYSNPVTTLGTANFGAITSARDPRIIQFGVKVNF
jgi:hypothetical protein